MEDKQSERAQLESLRSGLRDRYAIEDEIGAGGMAIVYLAKDLKSGRQVALKVLRPELANLAASDRFLREIKITAQLDHPNILPLFDTGQVDQPPYFTMPFVDGQSVHALIVNAGQMPLDRCLYISRQVAKALAYAHDAGFVHRDVKPENILISGKHVFVTDFGIARAVKQSVGERITSRSMVVGTPEYMSPEQCTTGESIDGRSDLYSLGCVLYEMLCGDPPFVGLTAQSVIARQIAEAPADVQLLRQDTPDHLQLALARVLQKSPKERYLTAQQFLEALDNGGP